MCPVRQPPVSGGLRVTATDNPDPHFVGRENSKGTYKLLEKTIRINPDLPDDLFNVETLPGTRVIDRDRDLSWTAPTAATQPVTTDIQSNTHFTVSPMKYALNSKPGQSIQTTLHLQNLKPNLYDRITLEVIDFHDFKDSQWLTLKPNTVNPNYLGLLNKKSCIDWIFLGKDKDSHLIDIGPLSDHPGHLEIDVPVYVEINIPPHTQGLFNAGILVTFNAGLNKGIVAAKYEFIVPLILNIGESAAPQSITKGEKCTMIINQEKSFRIIQNTHSSDPSHYSSDNPVDVYTSFPAGLFTSVRATSKAGGNWITSVTPKTALEQTKATVSLEGNDVRIENLTGIENIELGFNNNPGLAEVTVTLIPHCKE